MDAQLNDEIDKLVAHRPWWLGLPGFVAGLAAAGLWALAGLVWGWGGIAIVCGEAAILLGLIGLAVIGSAPFRRQRLLPRLVVLFVFASNSLGLFFFAALRILS
jgi:hypothetical protein